MRELAVLLLRTTKPYCKCAGLGKTVQALAVAAAYKDDWPGLIITPSSLRRTLPLLLAFH